MPPKIDDGLHILKDKWKQKKYLGPQSQLLADNLAKAIDATAQAAPERRQSFQLNRAPTGAIHDSEKERRLEAAMLLRWNRPNMSPIEKGWIRLVSFQVPLFDQQQKKHWGYIDLLGVNSSGLPVIVELKKGPEAKPNGITNTTETPLRMVLEAAAYGVALRKNWTRFRVEWVDRLTKLGVSEQIIRRVPDRLDTVPLVAAAPASFWIDWLPVTTKGRTVNHGAWQSFRHLIQELGKAQLPVSFVSITGHEGDRDGMAAQPFEFFPLIC